MKEHYAEAVHRDLDPGLIAAPEEDVTIRVFDADLNVLLTARRSSRMPEPVLSDAGEVRVKSLGKSRWNLSEYRWDRTERSIVAVKSACRPALSSPSPGLIFAVGCTANGERWFRMLRSDGRVLLKGEPASNEVEQAARGTTAGTFAIRTVEAAKSMSVGQPFTRGDLLKEKIALYRSDDGAGVSQVTSDDFALSEAGFAVSPSGEQMAMVGSRSILFYALGNGRK